MIGPRFGVLSLVGSLFACAPASATRPPGPPPAAPADLAPLPTAQTAAWTLRFVADAGGPRLEVEHDGATAQHPLHLDGRLDRAAVAIATLGEGPGAVVSVASLLESARPTDAVALRVVASDACAEPWVIDLAAEHLRAQTEWNGDGAALSHVRIGCGPVQHTDFLTDFGRERSVFYGATFFDPRTVAGELAVIRTRLEERFGESIDARWITEVVVTPRTAGARAAIARAVETGMRVYVDEAASWQAPARLEVAGTIANIWLLRLLSPDSTEAEPLSPAVMGIARGIAREEVFALGLISPDEYAEDLDNAELRVAKGRLRPGGRGALALSAVAAEFSLQTAIVAWAMRERGLDDNIPRRLRTKANARETDAPEEAWFAFVEQVLGADAAARLGRGGTAPLRKARLGRCIVAHVRAVELAVLDFDLDASASDAALSSIVSEVDAGGEAERAGMRVGDALITVIESAPLHIALTRDGKPLEIDVDVRVRKTKRRVWTRRTDLPDDRCFPDP